MLATIKLGHLQIKQPSGSANRWIVGTGQIQENQTLVVGFRQLKEFKLKNSIYTKISIVKRVVQFRFWVFIIY